MECGREPMTVKLLCLIVDRNKTKKVTDLLAGEDARAHFIALATGTAGTDLMALLGLESREKAFIICAHTAEKVAAMLRRAAEKLALAKPGKGIAFTVPLNGAARSFLTALAGSAANTVGGGSEMDGKNESSEDREKKGGDEGHAHKYCLILAMLGEHHVDELMNAARAAGARGGTVIQGRRMELGGAGSFLGIARQTNMDMVAIIATPEQKSGIMRAINAACGAATEAGGIVISLPVDDVEGLSIPGGPNSPGGPSAGDKQ